MSHLVASLAAQLAYAGLPEPEREYRFHPTRKWRFDLCFVEHKLAIEVEGGAFVGGRHSTGAGMTKDAEKYNQATLLGWRLLRFTAPMIRSGEALRTVEAALAVAV